MLRALRPSMLGVPGALLLAVSSPYARKGVLWEAYQAHWGQNDDRVLVWNACTMDMRPNLSPEFLSFLEDELRADPVAFDSEYRAKFRRDVEAYISLEQVQAVIVQGRAAREPGGQDVIVGRGLQDLSVLDLGRAAAGLDLKDVALTERRRLGLDRLERLQVLVELVGAGVRPDGLGLAIVLGVVVVGLHRAAGNDPLARPVRVRFVVAPGALVPDRRAPSQRRHNGGRGDFTQ